MPTTLSEKIKKAPKGSFLQSMFDDSDDSEEDHVSAVHSPPTSAERQKTSQDTWTASQAAPEGIQTQPDQAYMIPRKSGTGAAAVPQEQPQERRSPRIARTKPGAQSRYIPETVHVDTPDSTAMSSVTNSMSGRTQDQELSSLVQRRDGQRRDEDLQPLQRQLIEGNSPPRPLSYSPPRQQKKSKRANRVSLSPAAVPNSSDTKKSGASNSKRGNSSKVSSLEALAPPLSSMDFLVEAVAAAAVAATAKEAPPKPKAVALERETTNSSQGSNNSETKRPLKKRKMVESVTAPEPVAAPTVEATVEVTVKTSEPVTVVEPTATSKEEGIESTIATQEELAASTASTVSEERSTASRESRRKKSKRQKKPKAEIPVAEIEAEETIAVPPKRKRAVAAKAIVDSDYSDKENEKPRASKRRKAAVEKKQPAIAEETAPPKSNRKATKKTPKSKKKAVAAPPAKKTPPATPPATDLEEEKPKAASSSSTNSETSNAASTAEKKKKKPPVQQTEEVKVPPVEAELAQKKEAPAPSATTRDDDDVKPAVAVAPTKKKKKRTFQDQVLCEMLFSCKVYNLKTLAQACQTTETVLQHLLLSLLDKKVVLKKEFTSGKSGKTKVLYWANQESKAKEVLKLVPDEAEIQEAQEEVTALHKANAANARAMAILTQEFSNQEVNTQLAEMEAATKDLREKLAATRARIHNFKTTGTTGGKAKLSRFQKPKSAAQLAKERCPRRLKMRINAMRSEWKTRKLKCMDFIDQLADGMEKKPKQVVQLLDLETDEMEGITEMPPKHVI